MNQRIYTRICEKQGHDWAYKDEETFITKICLNCGCEQYFFPPEVELPHKEMMCEDTDMFVALILKARSMYKGHFNADLDNDDSKEN